MSDPNPGLDDAQLERLLADMTQAGNNVTADDLLQLQEFVERVGGVEAAKDFFDALSDEVQKAA